MNQASVPEHAHAGASTSVPVGDLSALLETVAETLDDPTWLRTRRREALERYHALAWPRGDEETWRRTPLRDAPWTQWRLPLAEDAASPPTTLPSWLNGVAPDDAAGVIMHADARLLQEELAHDLAQRGVLLAPLSQAAREYPDLVQRHLHALLPAGNDRFTALSAAMWTQGMFCYVPSGVRVDTPLYHLKTSQTDGAGILGQTLIVVEEGASLTLVEATASTSHSASARAPVFSHHSLEIVAEAGAQVHVVLVQNWDDNVSAFVTARARAGREANVQIASAVFGGRLHKERLTMDLAGEGASADLLGIFVAGGHQHVEFNTRQDHTAERGESTLLIKGALRGHARAVQYGVIKISPEGQRTVAQQTLRNLLLSGDAEADPIPVLEIEADDVKCAHAAAVGPVDPEHLFYLQARGIPPEMAERMVVQGFLDVVVDRLPDAHLRTIVESLVERKLQEEPAE